MKIGPEDEVSETDHSYYIQPGSLVSGNHTQIILPTITALISDEPFNPEFTPQCDPTQFRRKSRIWFSGSRLVTAMHFRSNFDVMFLLVSFPLRVSVEFVSQEYTESPGVDCISTNFSAFNLQDDRDRALQIWKKEDLHLPMLKRGLQPACKVLFRKDYRLRVNESSRMKQVDVKLFGRVNRSYSFNDPYEPSGDNQNQSQRGGYPVWLMFLEHQQHDFDVEGAVPNPTNPVNLPGERKPFGDVTAMVVNRFHVKNYFSEALLPLPITDASHFRKMELVAT